MRAYYLVHFVSEREHVQMYLLLRNVARNDGFICHAGTVMEHFLWAETRRFFSCLCSFLIN